MTPKQKAIVAVVAVVVLLMFGALAPKLVPWVIGGFGAFGGLKRLISARASAAASTKANAKATRARNARTRKATAEQARDLAEAADAPPPPDDLPTTDEERAERLKALGRWDD